MRSTQLSGLELSSRTDFRNKVAGPAIGVKSAQKVRPEDQRGCVTVALMPTASPVNRLNDGLNYHVDRRAGGHDGDRAAHSAVEQSDESGGITPRMKPMLGM